MSLILIGILLMFSFTAFIRYIITFSTEYISLFIFSLAFTFMIYAKNYTSFDNALLNIIVPGIIAVSLNFYLSDKIRNKNIQLTAFIISSLTALSVLLSVSGYLLFNLPSAYFLISLFILGFLFLGFIVYYIMSEKKSITFYNITNMLIFTFLLLSFIYLIFLMLFQYESGFLKYIPIIVFILKIEILYYIEKKEVIYKVDKCMNDENSIIKIRASEYSFTEREREIISLILIGMTSKEIAYTLCLSANTVNWHLQNMYKKSSVTNKADFIKIFSENQ